MPEMPPLVLDHLVAMTGRHGLYEHADHERPRHNHGHTTDDNARALVVLRPDVMPVAQTAPYLEFVLPGRVPVGWRGRGPGERGPGFDQQPIEAWAMADACSRANQVRADSRWERGLEDAALWFVGRNDTGIDLYDRDTEAGFDGLEAAGVDQNRGAESTLAALGALRALHVHQRAKVR